jgi:hypothetical protein
MTTWTKTFVCSILMTALTATLGFAAAGPYDGSRPFLCVVATIMECAASGQCERHITDDVDAPTFIRVDVAGKMLTAGANKKSPISSVTRLDGELILQGGENKRGWSATINEETGRMATAIVENDYVFSLFGTCTIP